MNKTTTTRQIIILNMTMNKTTTRQIIILNVTMNKTTTTITTKTTE